MFRIVLIIFLAYLGIRLGVQEVALREFGTWGDYMLAFLIAFFMMPSIVDMLEAEY